MQQKFASSSPRSSSKAMLPPPPPPPHSSSSDVDMECSMCGDVGFQKELFRCIACRQRYQHRYCSSFYPNLIKENQWICDWCLLRDNKASDLLSNIHPRPRQTITYSPPSKSPKSGLVPHHHPSPLDFLLEAAELESCSKSTPPSSSSSPSLGKGGKIRRIMSMPTSVKKFNHNGENAGGDAKTNTNTIHTNTINNTNHTISKNKVTSPNNSKNLIGTKTMNKQVKIVTEGKNTIEIPKNNSKILNDQNVKRKRENLMDAKGSSELQKRRPPPLLPPRPGHSKPPFSPTPSPSKVAARRYRLLSEVLC